MELQKEQLIPPSSTGGLFPDLLWMPEIVDYTEPHLLGLLLYLHTDDKMECIN